MRLHFKTLWVWRRLFHQQINNPQMSKWEQPTGFPTDILIYNPIKKCKVPLVLKNMKIANWYMCGPTVYDSSHVGHACTYVRFDIIRRILNDFFDIDVVSVMGITDIDDKIIRRSHGSSQFSDWKQLAKFYELQFYEQMAALNVLPPYLYCRVSDYIPQIIAFIEKIVSNDSAYLAKDGSVYFDTEHYARYGKFGQNTTEEPHPIKKSSFDFALWKASKEGEPSWDSPWGPGRPGWHIECSTMGSITLGNNIDLHSGGQDLMFPHHENEEAQSCCYHENDQWVNYWIHTGLLNLEDIKMSKSLQNTISIQELLEKYTVNEFRLLCLATHYRTPIDFSHTAMKKAVSLLKKINFFHSDCMNYMTGKITPKSIDVDLVYDKLNSARKRVHSSLADDFGTPRVVAEISNLIDTVNKMLEASQEINKDSINKNVACISAVSTYISRTLSLLGITKSTQSDSSSNKFANIIDNFVDFRKIVRCHALTSQEVKKSVLLGACDDARMNLDAYGIKLKDYKDTCTWTLTKD